MATAAVPPAELAMVSTRSVREKVFLMVDLLRSFLWSVAVVMTKRPLEKLVLPSKSSMTCETSVFRSAATSPLIFASVSHSTNWKPGGRSGMPPDAKLPSSHRLSITRHRSGYLSTSPRPMFYSSENEILQWPFLQNWRSFDKQQLLLQVQKAPQCPHWTENP